MIIACIIYSQERNAPSRLHKLVNKYNNYRSKALTQRESLYIVAEKFQIIIAFSNIYLNKEKEEIVFTKVTLACNSSHLP